MACECSRAPITFDMSVLSLLLVGRFACAWSSHAVNNEISVIAGQALSPAEQVIVQSIQGLVNVRSPKVWLQVPGASAVMLKQLEAHGSQVNQASTVWQLVDKYRSNIKGAIIYRLGTESLNVATGLCGPMSAIAVDETLAPKIKTQGIPIFVDARDITETEAYSRFHELYSKGIVVEQLVSKPGNLRDFAIKHHAFVMDASNSEFRKRVVKEAGPYALVLGWGRSESHWVADISEAGGTAVAADWCNNLSALEAIKTKRLHPRPQPKVKLEPDKRYVAFVVSDGDNLQWLTGDFITNSRFYNSPLRGSVPVSWEVSAVLGRFAPAVLGAIYDTAKPTDDFVAGPGLPGYTFPHLQADRSGLAKTSRPYLQETRLRVVTFLNQIAGDLSEVDPWMGLPEVDGALYKDYSGYARRKGELRWCSEKPIASYRMLLIERPGREDAIAKAIAAMPTKAGTNFDRFALVNVHAWSFANTGGPMGAIKRVADRLDSQTRVVTATQLLDLLKQQKGQQQAVP